MRCLAGQWAGSTSMLRQCPAQKVSTAGNTYNQRDQGDDHLSHQGTVSIFCVGRGHSCMHETQQELHSTDFFRRDRHGKCEHWAGERNVLTRQKCKEPDTVVLLGRAPGSSQHKTLLSTQGETADDQLGAEASQASHAWWWTRDPASKWDAWTDRQLQLSLTSVREPTQPCMYIHMYKQAHTTHTKRAVV